MKFWLNNEETTFNVCRTIRQSGELQSVSSISHKEKMKKENEEKSAKQEFMVGHKTSGNEVIEAYHLDEV